MRLAAGRVGGEGRCLAAEVRPYLELAECLSPSRVRGEGVGGERRGEEEKQLLGGGGGRQRRDLSPGRPSPAPPRTHSVSGGQEECQPHAKVPPTRCLSQEQDIHPTVGPISKAPSQQPSKLDLIILVGQTRKLRLGLVELSTQECSLIPVPSPGSPHCPRGNSQPWLQGWCEKGCVLKEAQLA